MARLHVVGVEALEVHLHLREHRRLDHAAEFFCFRRGLVGLGDHEGLTHADVGHPFDDVAVDGRPDAEGEHVGIAQVVPDEIEDLFLDGT